jgi:hypothetical protein
MGSKTKRRVSLGLVVNAETGEVLEGVKSKRHSQRKHTIMNTSETVSRMKRSEEKRVGHTRGLRLLNTYEAEIRRRLPQRKSRAKVVF